MHPSETFQLSIEFINPASSEAVRNKDDVKNWLLGMGEESFVEGAIDDLFLDLEYGESAQDEYEALGGNAQPLIIYKYDRVHLEDLRRELESRFSDLIKCQLDSVETQVWMEGWKESFKPIRTDRFYIYPPWLSDEKLADLHPLVIEPGMAFGTGQHATTVLCIEALESLPSPQHDRSFLDVGTGTGILAIAASKLDYSPIVATDIDPDSILAARDNAQANQVQLELEQGTFPQRLPYGLVMANIIFYVLRKIIGDLARATAPEGHLILSGLLSEERRDMEELAKKEGLILLRENVRDDWACQIYRKL